MAGWGGGGVPDAHSDEVEWSGKQPPPLRERRKDGPRSKSLLMLRLFLLGKSVPDSLILACSDSAHPSTPASTANGCCSRVHASAALWTPDLNPPLPPGSPAAAAAATTPCVPDAELMSPAPIATPAAPAAAAGRDVPLPASAAAAAANAARQEGPDSP